MPLGETEELPCPFPKWEAVSVYQYQAGLLLQVWWMATTAKKAVSYEENTFLKRKILISAWDCTKQTGSCKADSPSTGKQRNTYKGIHFPEKTILPMVGSRPKQIEMCWFYICPQAYFVVGEESLRNLELFSIAGSPWWWWECTNCPLFPWEWIVPWLHQVCISLLAQGPFKPRQRIWEEAAG